MVCWPQLLTSSAGPNNHLACSNGAGVNCRTRTLVRCKLEIRRLVILPCLAVACSTNSRAGRRSGDCGGCNGGRWHLANGLPGRRHPCRPQNFRSTIVVPHAYWPSRCGDMAAGERSVRCNCPALAQTASSPAAVTGPPVSGIDRHEAPSTGRSRPCTPAARDDVDCDQSALGRPAASGRASVECGQAALQKAPRLGACAHARSPRSPIPGPGLKRGHSPVADGHWEAGRARSRARSHFVIKQFK
jgi:hypothetical protein